MKGWSAACWSLILSGTPAAGHAEFDQCLLIDQVLNRMGNAIAINRLLLRKAMTARLSLRRVKLWPNRTRATCAPSANAPKPAAMAGNGTDCLAHARQAGGTLIERPWPSPSARTAEAAGFVRTDPWAGGWSVRTAALRPVAELRGPHRTAAGAATQNAGW